MHANFSNGAMRDQGGEELFKKICEELEKILIVTSLYMELTTTNVYWIARTQSIDKFSYGVSIVEHPYESQLVQYKMVGKVALKTAAQLLTVIRIKLQPLLSRQLKKLYRNLR